jgi:Methyltransferase domain
VNHRQRLAEIAEFLKTYEAIWQHEIMLLYPHPFVDYNMEWVEALARVTNLPDLIRLEKKQISGLISNPELLAFYNRIDELTAVEKVTEAAPMPVDSKTWLFMIPKKQYEIGKLAPVAARFYLDHRISRVIDIGGGVGFLAQTLANQYDMEVLSVDMDPVLQQTGRERHAKNFRRRQVQFLTRKVDVNDESFNSLLRPTDMSMGLHTCGNLANDQIRFTTKNRLAGLMNFGCCYHKLENSPDSQNISAHAKSLGLPEMSRYALTLASRAHYKMNEKDQELKQKVKLYRYAMHMLLHDEYDVKKLISLGNSNPKLYDEDFGTYALEQISRTQLTPRHSKDELNAYFMRPEKKRELWLMMASGFQRNALGRVLELYILLDRVCYLEEQGYQTQLLEFFDEETSPRNLGIMAFPSR